MSSIITNTILTNYPVAGVDNDSQGFRDNFTRIRDALIETKLELEVFESKSVLKSALTSSATVENNLSGSSLINGTYNKFYGTSSVSATANSNIAVSLWAGMYQSFSITSATAPHTIALTFTHWPATNQYANVRVQLTAATSTSVTLDTANIGTENGGDLIVESNFSSLTITNNAYYIIEAWSTDHGATVFVKYVGRFDKP